MGNTIRQSTLETLGLGTVLDIFRKGKLPVSEKELVDRVFGPKEKRGALVISGANGIVGAGKTMQLASRLVSYDVPIIALDLPGSRDGIADQYPGLQNSFGSEKSRHIMQNVIRLSYDGTHLPAQLFSFSPRFLLEAIPEILEIKKAHYQLFRSHFPEIEIRSVTSGFPSSALGVGIAHPAFPHQINKVFEIVEPKPSAITQLYWALGLLPIPVSDHWSFVLDVLFCGITLAALRYHHATNMPYWKIDKFVRKLLGPNPLRAHDAIGSKGADFLTWSCLHHLSLQYGALFTPTPDISERKDTGEPWYPPSHFRPLVNWPLTPEEEKCFNAWILGPVIQMTSLMLHENRSHLSLMNAIGEHCAQFRKGIPAVIRNLGVKNTVDLVNHYHKLFPQASKPWHPAVFENINTPEWQHLYVNAEYEGNIGVITLGRESYSEEVNAELNHAMNWLLSKKVSHIILCSDFHLCSQLVGADTSDFFPAIESEEAGFHLSASWSRTARRLNDDFQTSVGVVTGKRCWGGCLELFMHCHHLLAVENATFAMPEVTLPVVPGMEGCHWFFRKSDPKHWNEILSLLLMGKAEKATNTVGWLVDSAGPLETTLKSAWQLVSQLGPTLSRRPFNQGILSGMDGALSGWKNPFSSEPDAGQRAIADCIRDSCRSPLTEALEIQARHSAAFMRNQAFLAGTVGTDYQKTVLI